MSADAWSICPRCLRDAQNTIENHRALLHHYYGTVEPAEYLKMVNELAVMEIKLEKTISNGEGDGYTFRENYEFYGAETGVLKVSYSGVCQTCGLTLRFKQEHKIL